MNSSVSHKIKNRKVAKDVFITPTELAINHIKTIDIKEGEVWLDPCKNSGNYFNNFPADCDKDYCEILDGKDFLTYTPDKPISVICQNPPYSLLNKWIQKNIDLNPRVISLLIGFHNLTPRRIEILNKAGYGLTYMKMMKVHAWYGMSIIVNFEKIKENIIEIDRKIYK